MTAVVPDLAAAYLSATGRPFVPVDAPWSEGLEARICQVAETFDDELNRPAQLPRRPRWVA